MLLSLCWRNQNICDFSIISDPNMQKSTGQFVLMRIRTHQKTESGGSWLSAHKRTAKTSEIKVVPSQTGPVIKEITVKNATWTNRWNIWFQTFTFLHFLLKSVKMLPEIWQFTFESLFGLGCSTHAPEPNEHRTTRQHWCGEWQNFWGRGRADEARTAAAGRSDASQSAKTWSCVHENCASSYLRGLHSHKSTDGGDLNAHAASHALTSAGSCALFLLSQVEMEAMFRRSCRCGVISYLEAAARPFKAQINPLEYSTGNDAPRPHPHAHARHCGHVRLSDICTLFLLILLF